MYCTVFHELPLFNVDLHGFGSVAADLLPQHRAELQKIEELEYCVVMQSRQVAWTGVCMLWIWEKQILYR